MRKVFDKRVKKKEFLLIIIVYKNIGDQGSVQMKCIVVLASYVSDVVVFLGGFLSVVSFICSSLLKYNL